MCFLRLWWEHSALFAQQRTIFAFFSFFFNFSFFKQNQVPHIIAGLSRVIHHDKTFQIVIRTASIISKKCPQCQEKPVKILIFSSKLGRVNRLELTYLCFI